MPRAALAVAALWLVTMAGLTADELRGRVVAVADGDTITVLDAGKRQHKIRLNGIDAPESGQAFGQVAKQGLSALVFGQDVRVVWSKVDRYGRLVGTVTRGTLNANLEQLRAGLAWYYREYERDVAPEHRPLYAAAETDARGAKRGLWRDANPTPPWVYRSRASASTTPQGLLSTPAAPSPALSGVVIGNRNSRVYHAPGCPNYDDVAERNRVYFASEKDAEAAGFRKAGNCP